MQQGELVEELKTLLAQYEWIEVSANGFISHPEQIFLAFYANVASVENEL